MLVIKGHRVCPDQKEYQVKLDHAVKKENVVCVECGVSGVPAENQAMTVSQVIEAKVVRLAHQECPVNWAVKGTLVMSAILVRLVPKVIVACVVFPEVQVAKVPMVQKDLKVCMELRESLVLQANLATQVNLAIQESMVNMENGSLATKVLQAKTVDQEDLVTRDHLVNLECVVSQEKMDLLVIRYKVNLVHLA